MGMSPAKWRPGSGAMGAAARQCGSKLRRLTASFAARPAAVLALLLAACAAPATPPDQRPAPSVTATQPLGASSSALSAGPAQELQGTQPDDWPTYHLDSLRHGSGPASPVYDRVQQAWSA